VSQLLLLEDVQRDEHPHKRTTTTSKAAVYAIEATGEAERKRLICLRGLRALWNRHQEWPTADELSAYLFKRRLIPSKHRDEVAPRLNELADGWWLERLVNGVKVRRQVGGGEVERGAKRASRVSGRTVLTWRVREAGSLPARPVGGLR
jgi:hypothetical protein